MYFMPPIFHFFLTGTTAKSNSEPPRCSVLKLGAGLLRHACTRSGLPGALLRGLGFAGCVQSYSERGRGAGAAQKWVGGKIITALTPRGSGGSLGCRVEPRRGHGGPGPPAHPPAHLAGEARCGAGGKSASTLQFKDSRFLRPGTTALFLRPALES